MPDDNEVFGEGLDPEDMEETDTETFEIKVPRKDKSSKDLTDIPVENASDIPLFANADKRGLRTVAYLKLIKLDQPGSGYKGNIPLSSTLETIAQLYGDGLYTIEACNQKHIVLRREENVRIAMGEKKEAVISGQQKQIGTNGVDAKDHHINKLITEIASTRARDKELSDKAIIQIREQGDRFVTLVTATTESAAQRDREHMASVNKGQQDFFANMMQAQNQMFQQTMALMMASHSQTMQILQASSERDRENNNPMAMVQVLMQGLKMGRELDGDDTPDWLKAIGVGKDMLGQLTMLATMKGGGQKQMPLVSNPALPSNTKEETKSKKPTKRVLTDEELLEVARLKKELSARGMDLESVTKQARLYYQNLGESSDSSREPDEENETSNSSNVEGKGDNNSGSPEE